MQASKCLPPCWDLSSISKQSSEGRKKLTTTTMLSPEAVKETGLLSKIYPCDPDEDAKGDLAPSEDALEQMQTELIISKRKSDV